MNFSVSNTVCSTFLFVLFSLVCPGVLRRYSIKAFTQFSNLVALSDCLEAIYKFS